eukprot:CAMPEP_0175878736 /NCGR_PEP_ID=MMETSP0107_2-20121207/41357_1 /TAXON_ID=195067 ORGANISM="Goniomonas pacifica, Strain CCMP1869" /NCGR_SAMPLE_ID=MMETSP0107_2 /ASSEMBLY_ACC=CAM_ASM_000203 /LENGTH=85 /DNA_ID=CAMNT_0017198261 /DNA_START=37 /DNA_END=295 /DNA_ORIENTATION=+
MWHLHRVQHQCTQPVAQVDAVLPGGGPGGEVEGTVVEADTGGGAVKKKDDDSTSTDTFARDEGRDFVDLNDRDAHAGEPTAGAVV